MLVNAGPTHETIDPVRYIGNHSTGKMGYAIADAFAAEGAEVTLVSGPVNILPGNSNIDLVKVTSAKDMFDAFRDRVEDSDVVVFTAAVADFTPARQEAHKVKRGQQNWNLELVPTVDIAAELGKNKKKAQLFIGFALETEKGLEHARGKLRKKNQDLVVLNFAGEEGAGFGSDTNRVSFVDHTGVEELEMKPKALVAKDLVNRVIKMMDNA